MNERMDKRMEAMVFFRILIRKKGQDSENSLCVFLHGSPYNPFLGGKVGGVSRGSLGIRVLGFYYLL